MLTHRVFSRNASSSRAIPVERLIRDVLDDPAVPIHWGKNQKGMQAREEHMERVEFFSPLHRDQGRFVQWYEDEEVVDAKVVRPSAFPRAAWLQARDYAIGAARAFAKAGYHKQVVNRLLEPFAHINVVVTATEWDNFFRLRLHPDAQPEIHELARVMKAAMDASEPVRTDLHLPYVEDKTGLSQEQAMLVSAARCARVSYLTHDGRKTTPNEDLELALRLKKDGHMSPFEHQAVPAWGWWANFFEWRSFRSLLEAVPETGGTTTATV